MKTILLAGSTASGKTTLAQMLAHLGAYYIEIEDIFFRYFETTIQGKNVLLSIAPHCYLETGLVDRRTVLNSLSPAIISNLRASLTTFVFTYIEDCLQHARGDYTIIVSHAGPVGLKQQLVEQFKMPVYLIKTTRESRIERLKSRNQATDHQIQTLLLQDDMWFHAWENDAYIIPNHSCLTTLFNSALELHQTLLL